MLNHASTYFNIESIISSIPSITNNWYIRLIALNSLNRFSFICYLLHKAIRIRDNNIITVRPLYKDRYIFSVFSAIHLFHKITHKYVYTLLTSIALNRMYTCLPLIYLFCNKSSEKRFAPVHTFYMFYSAKITI